ncbi:MAG: four helix bundle protein [Saprospiraceae bacterium]|nr:four helix bundle protein [Saprospiraceae bacterium]
MKDVDLLKKRFKDFALDVVKFAEMLPSEKSFKVVANQIMRSSTSTAANYRAASRGRSRPDFRAKLGIVEEELDETMFWLEFIVGLSESYREPITPLWKEANELLSITVASIKTSKKNTPPPK